MRTALSRGDVIRICIDSLLIGIVILHGDLYEAVIHLSSHVDRSRIDLLLMAVKILNECDDTAVIMEMYILRLIASVIVKIYGNFAVKESHLTVTRDHRIEVECDVREDSIIRDKRSSRTCIFHVTVAYDM